MNEFSMRYNGQHKINAIKAVREVFGLGLKESKDIVEGDEVRITALQRLAVLGVYPTSSMKPTNVAEHDWKFCLLEPMIERKNLTRNVPIGRTAEQLRDQEANRAFYAQRNSKEIS